MFLTYVLALELIDHESAPTIAHEVHVRHPDPVLGDLGPCDQEAREEEQGGDVSRKGGICCVHVRRDGCYQVRQHFTAQKYVTWGTTPYSNLHSLAPATTPELHQRQMS